MRIGETLTFKLGNETVVLRPSLRHAFELQRRDGGIFGLGKAMDEQSLTAACLIIRHHTQMPFLEHHVFDAGLDKLAPVLSNYLLALLGVDPFDPKFDQPLKGLPKKPKPYIEVLTQLFGIATGWLGWCPKDAWDASPMEIIAAYKARQDMLRAIFGGEEPSRNDPTKPVDLDAKVKAIFGNIGTVREE